ncbi:alpha/beta-hydrolase [Hyaloscypha bicolor E]|uniref:Alpha/beta-hydrolase n=1 Tax=Hyaloscypha bicolor E TaxID=1095630 RepID=A0A2J6TM87_9HELO|nr:alpha/beta-hydrolase [Hyaloscypha bicolor E]PMD64140.1 alpha/beta-hydrolase [Hyaloscypha bicolor E]
MADPGLREGIVPLKIQHIDAPCHIYYNIIGDLSSNSPRLIVLHGGPGTGHEYLLPTGDESFGRKLCDGPGYRILGHSWGRRIAVTFATTQPRVLQRLVLASGIASSRGWVEGIQIIRRQLPSDAQLAIDEEEQKGNFESARFRDAMSVFFRNYLCRAKPFPPKELLPERGQDSGPSPLDCTGSFRDWSCTPYLHQIAVPTLVYNGEFDTSHDITTVPFFEHIPRVRWITFPDAGHICHLERPELAWKEFRIVGEFLTQKK